jgi:ADP-ribose pyrophosphatase YjhB (NUDIX family)
MGGSYGPPGGSVNRRESAQCAAERETWEETGVEARAGELAITFENGFQLYFCESVSGRDITITRPLEIKDADWFSDEQLSQLRWRYPEQGSIIKQLVQGGES